MHDRPTAVELVLAAKEHLEKALVPALSDPKLRYQTLVAAHVLGMVSRELQIGEAPLRAELRSARELLGTAGAEPSGVAELYEELARANAALAAGIRRGEVADGERLRAHLRAAAILKLAVANPLYSSLRPSE